MNGRGRGNSVAGRGRGSSVAGRGTESVSLFFREVVKVFFRQVKLAQAVFRSSGAVRDRAGVSADDTRGR